MAKKKPTKVVQKTYSPEQVDLFVEKNLRISGSEAEVLKKMGDELLPKFYAGDQDDLLLKEISNIGGELMRMRESDHHCNLMEGFDERYRQLSKVMTDQIITEYDCTTEIEKSLASVIVGSHVRYLDNSRRLNNELNCEDITRNRNVYIANLSKQVDRAQRQYLSSVQALKMLKVPEVSMNINVDQAFVSQNQQFNSQNKNNETN